MVKRTIKRWQTVCWEELSRWKRSSGRCVVCGKIKEPKKLHAHHIIPKSKGNYAKFESDNIVAMCGMWCHKNWWHGQSTWDEQLKIIEREIGLDRYWEIKRKSNKTIKYREEDYEKMLECFKNHQRYEFNS